MKITIESTEKIVELNGVPARVWEGQTENGIKCYCFVTRIFHDEDEPRTEEFKRDLEEHQKPSPEMQAIPLRFVL